MAMGSMDRETVRLIPDQLNMSQKVDMPIFRIVEWSLQTKSFEGGSSGVSMIITMKRKIISEMMTTYFPSLLLTAITFATTFFKPFFFEAALSVNLTTMLVMTTIFISKMEGLPPTSDIKMIDIWLVLCQMVPFAEVVLLTAMEYNREEKKKGRKTKKKGKGKTRKVKTTSLAVAPMDECRRGSSHGIEDGLEEKICQRCWIPELKTIGDNTCVVQICCKFNLSQFIFS